MTYCILRESADPKLMKGIYKMTYPLVSTLSRSVPMPLKAFLVGTKLWLSKGGEHTFKQETILSYVRKHQPSYFVETGTYCGDMIDAVRSVVPNVYSIELDDYLFRICRARFCLARNVTILKGDSGQVLQHLLPTIHGKILFWLDGHYSGHNTAKGLLKTPIMQELNAIKSHPLKEHIILIDDIRCFGQGDYPSIDTVCKFIKTINNNYHIQIVDDILRAKVAD